MSEIRRPLLHQFLKWFPTTIGAGSVAVAAVWEDARDWIGSQVGWACEMLSNPIIACLLLIAVAVYVWAIIYTGGKQSNSIRQSSANFIRKDEITDAFGKPPLVDQNLEDWGQLNEITLAQAACLYEGIEPPEDGGVPSAAKPRLEQLRQLVISGDLKTLAIDLRSHADKLISKFNHIHLGTKPVVNPDTRVLVSNVVGCIKPNARTPKFLIGKDDE